MKPIVLVILGLILMLIGAIIVKKVFAWALFIGMLGVIGLLVWKGLFSSKRPTS